MIERLKYYLCFLLLAVTGTSISQIDTLKNEHIEQVTKKEVTVSEMVLRVERIVPIIYGLDTRRIEELSPTDVGDLVQRLPGATMRSYGGIGGLKTVSFRGLGSSHTGVVINGIPLNNVQTGMMNLAQIPVESIVNISSYNGLFVSGIPVSSAEKGNVVVIQTYEDLIERDTKYKMRSSIKMGSFGTTDAYVASKYSTNKICYASYAKYRRSVGDYSYTWPNTSGQEVYRRKNNNYHDLNFGLTLGGFTEKNAFWRIAYKGKLIDQQLPGAVILYNETADEKLNTSDHLAYGTYNKYWEKANLKVYGVGNINQVQYQDPTYLNQQGFINNSYFNQSAIGGAVFDYRFYRWFVKVGTEQLWSHLKSNEFEDVNRMLNSSNISAMYHLKHLNISAGTTTQFGVDNQTDSKRVFFQWSPIVNLYSKFLLKKELYLVQGLTGKRSFRLPSFNEMYYGNIGNADLLPETSDQLSYTLILDRYLFDKNFYWRFGMSPYMSLVRNKIVATPSKNLFIWTIQNVESVMANGVEFQMLISKEYRDSTGSMYGEYSLRPKWDVNFNYNFQYVVDITDKASSTYKNQIAYTPMHTMNLTGSYYIKRFGFILSNYFVSYRYVLNENNYQNLENGFILTDLSFVYSHEIKKKNKVNTISLNCSVKNAFNVQYAFIRSFAMPGRNFLISINYALD